jgi:hypothetical protein
LTGALRSRTWSTSVSSGLPNGISFDKVLRASIVALERKKSSASALA